MAAETQPQQIVCSIHLFILIIIILFFLCDWSNAFNFIEHQGSDYSTLHLLFILGLNFDWISWTRWFHFPWVVYLLFEFYDRTLFLVCYLFYLGFELDWILRTTEYYIFPCVVYLSFYLIEFLWREYYSNFCVVCVWFEFDWILKMRGFHFPCGLFRVLNLI